MGSKPFLICIMLMAIIYGYGTMPALAISPEEQLKNPVQEKRARHLSQQLRCLVCDNQSINESDADLARDLRRFVREKISAGDTDQTILEDLRTLYGDYILLKPPITPTTYLLWLSPILVVSIGIGLFWLHRRLSIRANTKSPAIEQHSHSVQKASQSGTASIPVKVIICIVASIIVVGGGIYSQLGRPHLAGQPLASRAVEKTALQTQTHQIDAQNRANLAAAQIEAQNHPHSVETQLQLAMAAAQSGDITTEITALETALHLSFDNPAIQSLLAEALSRQAGGLVTLPARDLIKQVLAVSPDEPRALFLSGLAAYQDENYTSAVMIWQKLQKLIPSDSPLAEQITQNITLAAQAGGIDIAGHIDDEVIAAADTLSVDAREEMILSMVNGLEEKLIENSDDSAGWSRLINARRQLQDQDGLMRALYGAANSQPDNYNAQLEALEETLAAGISSAWLDDAQKALERMRIINPDGLEVLFFSGHFAELLGQTDKAIEAWRHLAHRLPADSPFVQELEIQIQNLSKNKPL